MVLPPTRDSLTRAPVSSSACRAGSMWCNSRTRSLTGPRVEFRRGGLNPFSRVFQNLADPQDLLLSELPLFLLDALPNSGQRFNAVAGVIAWRVNLMLEPTTARQAIAQSERVLHGYEVRVQSAQRHPSRDGA